MVYCVHQTYCSVKVGISPNVMYAVQNAAFKSHLRDIVCSLAHVTHQIQRLKQETLSDGQI